MYFLKMKKTLICIATALFMTVALMPVFSLSVQSEAFKYVHDPAENPTAMKDIVKDENAIYGFRPSETGSLKKYAAADWSDPAVVEAGRQERIAYHNSFSIMYDMLDEMQAEGKTIEEIARAISTKRNELRIASYDNDPEGLETLKQRNLEEFGHEEGPLPEQLFTKYGSWETVLLKAFSTNSGMDACLGLYDDYYYVYLLLGQIEDTSLTIETTTTEASADKTEETVISPKTGDEFVPKLSIIIMLLSGSTALSLLVVGKKRYF